MPRDSHQHLATIVPVDRRFAGTSLGPWFMLRYAVSIFVFSSGWCLVALGGLYLSIDNPFHPAIGTGLIAVSLAWLGSVILLALTYPEWPHNQDLCRRLRRSIRRRHPVELPGFHARVVELVPRDRWHRVRLETATDLMTIEIDDQGIRMKGDRYDYHLPGESILGVKVESATPSGWLCRSHMAVLIVRTCDGTVELPIAYRDFVFGSLRSSQRKRETINLAGEIARIAAGDRYHAPTTPPNESMLAWSVNPYASPALLNDHAS